MIENFGLNVSRLRKAKGMNQEDFAKKLGVSKQTISTIENGDSYPTFKNLEKISQILDASPIQLFGTSKEIAIADTPAILSKIDEYDNKVQNILRADKIIGNGEYINDLSDKISRIEGFFTQYTKLDHSGMPIIDEKHQTYELEDSYFSTIQKKEEQLNSLADKISRIEGFFAKYTKLDHSGMPIIDEKHQTYELEDSYFQSISKKEPELDRIISKIKFIQEHNFNA